MLALREASNHLTLARTEMHGFDPKAVAAVLAEGTTITATVNTAADAGEHELSYRKTGLAVTLGFIVLVIIALRLKLRALGH